MLQTIPGRVLALPAAGNRSDRYRFRLDVSQAEGCISVIDRWDRSLFLQWRGELASQLIRLGHLASITAGRPPRYCSKNEVRHLALAAASISFALSQHREPGPSDCAQTGIGRSLTLQHRKITDTLRHRRPHHFSHDELLCLLSMEHPGMDIAQLETRLAELVEWGQVQRIEVSPERIFYDIDTRPHLHVFDRRTGTLKDAPAVGCLVV